MPFPSDPIDSTHDPAISACAQELSAIDVVFGRQGVNDCSASLRCGRERVVNNHVQGRVVATQGRWLACFYKWQ